MLKAWDMGSYKPQTLKPIKIFFLNQKGLKSAKLLKDLLKTILI